jgi:hypothetical protein
MYGESERNGGPAGVEILDERFDENAEREDNNRTWAKKAAERTRGDYPPAVK